MKAIRLTALSIFILLLAGCHQSGIPNLPFLPEPDDPPPDDTVVIDSTSVPPTSRAERIVWLQSNARRVRSIQPQEDDFSDLEPLRQHIDESRIVVLGGQTPWDGAIQLAKTRLIKFLHREMGFDVLAFEGGIFDCAKAWEEIQAGKDLASSFQAALPEFWGYSQQMQDLVEYVGQNRYSHRPLNIIGLDCEFTGTYAGEWLYWDLNEYMKSIGAEPREYPGWSTFICYLEKLSNHDYEAPDENRQAAFFDVAGRLRGDIYGRTPASDRQAAFWLQVIESTETEAKRRWWEWGLAERNPPPYYWNEKSNQMGKNLLAYTTVMNPDEKIIIWAQSRHVCRRIDAEVTNRYGHIVTNEMTSMVDAVWDVLGADVYTCIFTAFQGRIEPYFGLMDVDIGPVWNGDLEDLMNEAGFDLAFIDVRGLSDYRSPASDRVLPANGAWFRDGLIMSPMNYIRMKANDWTHIIDGVFFIRDMTPSSRTTY